jgi:hypothetical protein
MMFIRFGKSVVVALSLLTFVSTTEAQNRKAAGDSVRLNAEAPSSADRSTFQDLRDGKLAVDNSHKDVLKKQAEFLVYRVTHEEYQFKKFQPDSGLSMKNLLDDASKSILVPTPQKPLSDNQRKFMREFGKAMTDAIKEVFGNERAIARVNAGIILAKLGETGIDDFAEAMCEAIEHKDYDDAVKHYAMKGLANLFEAKAKADDRRMEEAREARCIKALIGFIQRKPASDPSTRPSDEVDALSFVRREAIRALGQTRVPAIGKARQIEAVPSFELLRIVSNTGEWQPPLSLVDRAEAVIALAQMQRKNWSERSDYQPEYAAYHIGKFIVEFAAAYDNERGKTSTMDWKYLAYRMAQALADMKNEASGKFAKLDAVVARSTAVVNGITAGGGADTIALINWLEQNTPDAKSLLKGEDSTALKPPEPAEKTGE